MLIATFLGVLLIPMLYVAVERAIGGEKKHAPAPMVAATGPLRPAHGQPSH